MRAELWLRQHTTYSAFVGLLLLLMFWSTVTTRSRRESLTAADTAAGPSLLVAKMGHLFPLPDRHVPFAVEKRNGRYTLIFRNR